MYATCGGSCLNSFHAACVGLPEQIVNCFLKNVIWLCDACLEEFNAQTSKKICSDQMPLDVAAEITDMKSKITQISETLSAVVSHSAVRDDISSMQCSIRHSTPKTSTRLISGSRARPFVAEKGSSIDHGQCVKEQEENTFALFLTNIDACVSEQELVCMVAESLSFNEKDQIEVVLLVPKWKLNSSLRYASFKVILPTEFKRKALEPKTWPADVMFREFIDYPRRTWRPAAAI